MADPYASLRPGFLRIVGASAEDWARIHEIEPFAHPCSTCGALLETSIPFAFGDGRGLVAPACECGNVLTPYCIVGASVDLLRWRPWVTS